MTTHEPLHSTLRILISDQFAILELPVILFFSLKILHTRSFFFSWDGCNSHAKLNQCSYNFFFFGEGEVEVKQSALLAVRKYRISLPGLSNVRHTLASSLLDVIIQQDTLLVSGFFTVIALI